MSIRSVTSRKLVIAGVCVVVLVACCGLAWWQWERYSSAGGSFQNLGYVLQWPLFGFFPVFMVWRIRKLNRQEARRHELEDRDEEPQATARKPGSGVLSSRAPRGARADAASSAARAPTGRAVRHADTEADAALAEYNRYLAELNARDREEN